MKKNWRNYFLPLWMLVALFWLTAAMPQQSPLEDIPWWVWLVVIAVILLVMFALVLVVDWRSAGNREGDDTE